MTKQIESTATLLLKVKAGDNNAREQLCKIYIPLLSKWAHGRLPKYARDMAETDDLVQVSLMKALEKLDSFTPIREGSFLSYLRKILLNNIRMEIRRYTAQSKNRQMQNEIEIIDPNASLLEQTIGHEIIEKYERALTKIPQRSREAVILRVEFGFSYLEIAAALNCASVSTARMIVSRALLKLAGSMK